MAGPSWLAGTFAAVVILAGAYSASRLVISLRRGRATEPDADALHAVMGAAMAGMLVPRLSVLPGGVWLVIFGIAAAWFGWRAVRARGFAAVVGSPFRLPVPHLIECVAMLYMLLPVHGPGPAHGQAGMAMGGMGAYARPGGQLPGACGNPRPVHARLHRVDDRPAGVPWPAPESRRQAQGGTASQRQWSRWRLPPTPRPIPPAAAAGTRRGDQAGGPVLAPGLATCGKLAMSIAMGYMLLLML